MKKIFTFILATAAMLTTTSCLKDEILVTDPDTGFEYDPHFDYSAPKPVVEFMTETNASTINCKDMKGVGAAYVNLTVDDAKKILEDVTVGVELDMTLAGANLLPAEAYKVRVHSMADDTYASFPLNAVIPAYAKLPNRRPNTEAGNPTENVQLYEANRQSVSLVIEVDASNLNLEAGAYKLPLCIKSVSGYEANVSGNYGYQVVTINLK